MVMVTMSLPHLSPIVDEFPLNSEAFLARSYSGHTVAYLSYISRSHKLAECGISLFWQPNQANNVVISSQLQLECFHVDHYAKLIT